MKRRARTGLKFPIADTRPQSISALIQSYGRNALAVLTVNGRKHCLAVLRGGCHQSLDQLRCDKRGFLTLHGVIERFFEVLFDPGRRRGYQHPRSTFTSIAEVMHDAPRQMGTMALRCVYRLVTDANGQSSFEEVERLVLAVVSMGWRTASRGNHNFGQEKRSVGLFSGENEPDLISRAPVDWT